MSEPFALNDAQRRAVEHPGGPLLVIAGAGSGKTRVLTARVARLIERGVAPDRVLAFTFTNRAAREMRERIGRALGDASARVWVGTFHATGARILRREAARLASRRPGFPADFSIYDREDQEGVVREVLRALELPEGAYRVGDVLRRISDAKNALVTPPEAARAAVTPFEREIARAFAAYEAALAARGALDFDDLIGGVVRLFRESPETGARYAARFEHVLVDEYQDTNHAQFRLVEALAAGHGNLFVVGDDDQSIYGWRGADLANVLDFERAFPGADTVRLEQNYRSTANILRAANAVIANNRSRKGKTLWCDREDGARLRFALLRDEADEARWIAAAVAERVRRGRALADLAVLYRTNAQSRALETELAMRGIRYEIVGGVAFYQRREVKDVLAYLRAGVNPSDAAAFWRAMNTPKRGLGDAVRRRIEERMAAGAPDPVEGLRALIGEGALGRAAGAAAAAFLAIVDGVRARAADPVDAVLDEVLERSRYAESLGGEDEDAEDRRANLEELRAGAAAFAAAAENPGVAAFLSETALLTDLDKVEEGADRLLLLTAHNAKGLEFPVVIVAGLEEGLFPHASALDDPHELEEERRLFYVALTRARDEVLLCAAAWRRRHDALGGGAVSRFVDEVPGDLLDREGAAPAWGRGRGDDDDADGDGWSPAPRGQREGGRAHAATVASAPARPRAAAARVVGREVWHEQFGRGVVLDADGEGPDAKYTVRFGTQVKRVFGRYLAGGSGDDHA